MILDRKGWATRQIQNPGGIVVTNVDVKLSAKLSPGYTPPQPQNINTPFAWQYNYKAEGPGALTWIVKYQRDTNSYKLKETFDVVCRK